MTQRNKTGLCMIAVDCEVRDALDALVGADPDGLKRSLLLRSIVRDELDRRIHQGARTPTLINHMSVITKLIHHTRNQSR